MNIIEIKSSEKAMCCVVLDSIHFFSLYNYEINIIFKHHNSQTIDFETREKAEAAYNLIKKHLEKKVTWH